MLKMHEDLHNMLEPRTTIGVKRSTKEMLDSCRAPGQTYEGFIQEMLGLWEEAGGSRRGQKSYQKEVMTREENKAKR